MLIKTMAAAATIAAASLGAWAQEKPERVFYDQEDGVYVLRHADLAKEVQEANAKCQEYHGAVFLYERDYGDELKTRRIGLEPVSALVRELPARTAELSRLKQGCVDLFQGVARRVSRILSSSAGERLLRAYAAGDLAYLKLRPKTRVEELMDPLTK